jgi:hypothetical protein
MIFGNWLWPLRRRQLFSAASASLKIMASAVLFERHPLERTVRWRTVANELSMTFVTGMSGTFAAAVTHARAAHSDRTDAGHDLAFGQMPAADQPPAAIIGKLVGMRAQQARNLGLDGLRQKRSRAVAQNLGQRIGKSPWLRELENISVGHGVSLLCWRSGGVGHPHDTPPYPFTPSPTFAHSSLPMRRNR